MYGIMHIALLIHLNNTKYLCSCGDTSFFSEYPFASSTIATTERFFVVSMNFVTLQINIFDFVKCFMNLKEKDIS